MSSLPKEFLLSHIFNNVSSMKDGVDVFSRTEEHSGFNWKICAKLTDGCLACFCYCSHPENGKNWSVQVSRDFRLISVTGRKFSARVDRLYSDKDGVLGFGPNNFIKWEDMIRDYAVDDKIMIQVHVKISKVTGIQKKKLRSFDESAMQFSDIVLLVENERFYVSKLFLAAQSSYFQSLFLGDFKEFKSNEIPLSNVEAKDFQNFLELLHGELVIDDSTVDGILKLADMYDAQTAVKRCEQYLIESSEKTLKEKLNLAIRYRFEDLKHNCLLRIETVEDIKSVLPGDLKELDPEVSNALLQKMILLHQ